MERALIERALSVLHPGAVGLIHNNHGTKASARAGELVMDLRAALVRASEPADLTDAQVGASVRAWWFKNAGPDGDEDVRGSDAVDMLAELLNAD